MNSYQTTNASLAATLAIAGVPPAPLPGGKRLAQMMLYTLEGLRKLGFRGIGAFDAAREAMRQEKSGIRVYCFERTEDLEKIVAGWAEGDISVQDKKDLKIAAPSMKDLGRWGAYFSAMRKEILTGWKIPAYVGFGDYAKRETKPFEYKGEKVPEIEITIAQGSFSVVSIDAPDAIKREVRV